MLLWLARLLALTLQQLINVLFISLSVEELSRLSHLIELHFGVLVLVVVLDAINGDAHLSDFLVTGRIGLS